MLIGKKISTILIVAGLGVGANPNRSWGAMIDKFTELAGPNSNPDSTNAAGASVDAWTVVAPAASGSGTRTYSSVNYWNIFSNTNAGAATLQTHVFDSALNIGQAVSIDYANRGAPAAGTGRSIGLRYLDAGGNTQIEFSLISDNNNFYRYFDTGSDTYTNTTKTFVASTVFNVSIALTGTVGSATTYTGTAGTTTWSGSFTSPITQIQVFNDIEGGGSDVSTNNLAITPEPASVGLIGGMGALGLLRRRRRGKRHLFLASSASQRA
jgi:hypothetical protein